MIHLSNLPVSDSKVWSWSKLLVQKKRYSIFNIYDKNAAVQNSQFFGLTFFCCFWELYDFRHCKTVHDRISNHKSSLKVMEMIEKHKNLNFAPRHFHHRCWKYFLFFSYSTASWWTRTHKIVVLLRKSKCLWSTFSLLIVENPCMSDSFHFSNQTLISQRLPLEFGRDYPATKWQKKTQTIHPCIKTVSLSELDFLQTRSTWSKSSIQRHTAV